MPAGGGAAAAGAAAAATAVLAAAAAAAGPGRARPHRDPGWPPQEDRAPLLPPQPPQPPQPVSDTTKWTQHLAAILATLLSVSAGMVLGWTSPALPLLQLPSRDESWVGSLAPLGALVGALPAGWLTERLGRRRLLILLGWPYLAGFLLLAFGSASQSGLLYAGRTVSGVAIGASTLVLPLYCDEVAEDKIRGALGVYLDLNMTVGILAVYVLGTYLSVLWMSLACALVPMLFLVSFPFMPESPVHLVAKGRHREARASMAFLRGEHTDISPELTLMQKMLDGQKIILQGPSNGNLEAGAPVLAPRRPPPATKRAVCLVLGLMAFQQLCGINAVIFYTVDIFEAAGSSLSPWVSTMIVGAVQVAASIVSFAVVDRIGRRALLAMSCALMALSLAALAAYSQLKENGYVWGGLPVAALSVYIFFYSVGFGPLPWFMMAELLPVEAKDWATAIAIATNWALVFVVTNTFEPFVAGVGIAAAYSTFCSVCVAGLAFVMIFIPETKGRSQDEIQQMLRAGHLT